MKIYKPEFAMNEANKDTYYFKLSERSLTGSIVLEIVDYYGYRVNQGDVIVISQDIGLIVVPREITEHYPCKKNEDGSPVFISLEKLVKDFTGKSVDTFLDDVMAEERHKLLQTVMETTLRAINPEKDEEAGNEK